MKNIKLLILLLLLILPSAMQAQTHENLRVVFISASNEYVSHITLKAYKKYLEKTYPGIRITILQGNGPVNDKDEYTNLDGTDALKNCDVLLVFARRTGFSGKAIDDLKAYVQANKPIVALRTASHGFQAWPEFDKEVLGGNYIGHYYGEPEKRVMGADSMRYVVGEPFGPVQTVTVNNKMKQHPVLKGVHNFKSKYSLYQTSPIAADASLLLSGTTKDGTEPLAWARTNHGERVVYIALGGVQDWTEPNFRTLVTNALFWAAAGNTKHK
ncbi:MAG: ThuA domain-containing protein [Bacteroidota bacterium]|nr:ThuA domain-containing protein [Bacteroidota bacterium]